MPEFTKVGVARYFKGGIKAYVDNESFGTQVTLPVFMDKIKENFGSPAFVITKAQLSAKLDEAVKTAIEDLKREVKYYPEVLNKVVGR